LVRRGANGPLRVPEILTIRKSDRGELSKGRIKGNGKKLAPFSDYVRETRGNIDRVRFVLYEPKMDYC